MATLAQLQAEPWWGREVVTPELDWLGDELCRRTGRPRAAAGTKGDTVHMRGAHRSQEWILNSRYCTSRTYTVQQGLTADQLQHIAGFDFTPGTAADMVAMCRRLDAALRAGRLEEIREFYGNTNGDRIVDGWDNLNNRAATSDDSHLWHIHLSFDRRQLRNRGLMERVLAVMLGDPVKEDDMALTDIVPGTATEPDHPKGRTVGEVLGELWSMGYKGTRLGNAQTAGGLPIVYSVRQDAVEQAALARIEARLAELAENDTEAPAGAVTLEQAKAALREVFADAGDPNPDEG
jgi:hypothetical protein